MNKRVCVPLLDLCTVDKGELDRRQESNEVQRAGTRLEGILRRKDMGFPRSLGEAIEPLPDM